MITMDLFVEFYIVALFSGFFAGTILYLLGFAIEIIVKQLRRM